MKQFEGEKESEVSKWKNGKKAGEGGTKNNNNKKRVTQVGTHVKLARYIIRGFSFLSPSQSMYWKYNFIDKSTENTKRKEKSVALSM